VLLKAQISDTETPEKQICRIVGFAVERVIYIKPDVVWTNYTSFINAEKHGRSCAKYVMALVIAKINPTNHAKPVWDTKSILIV